MSNTIGIVRMQDNGVSVLLREDDQMELSYSGHRQTIPTCTNLLCDHRIAVLFITADEIHRSLYQFISTAVYYAMESMGISGVTLQFSCDGIMLALKERTTPQIVYEDGQSVAKLLWVADRAHTETVHDE